MEMWLTRHVWFLFRSACPRGHCDPVEAASSFRLSFVFFVKAAIATVYCIYILHRKFRVLILPKYMILVILPAIFHIHIGRISTTEAQGYKVRSVISRRFPRQTHLLGSCRSGTVRSLTIPARSWTLAIAAQSSSGPSGTIRRRFTHTVADFRVSAEPPTPFWVR